MWRRCLPLCRSVLPSHPLHLLISLFLCSQLLCSQLNVTVHFRETLFTSKRFFLLLVISFTIFSFSLYIYLYLSIYLFIYVFMYPSIILQCNILIIFSSVSIHPSHLTSTESAKLKHAVRCVPSVRASWRIW